MSVVDKIVRLKTQSGLSIRQISQALNLKRSTVADYLRRFNDAGLTAERFQEMNDTEREAALFPEKGEAGQKSRLRLPDFSRMHIELRKRYVTRQLLWEEYRSINPNGYGYSQCRRHLFEILSIVPKLVKEVGYLHAPGSQGW